MFTKKKGIFTGVALCCCIILSAVILNIDTSEGSIIRNKYPLIETEKYVFDTNELEFAESVRYAPNIAEIEILERLPNYTVTVEDEEMGISDEVTFNQYKVRILDDVAETHFDKQSDGTIIICFAEGFAESYPNLTDGMNAICSIEAAGGDHTGKYLLYDKTFYYIDSGLALAAYEGDKSPASNYCEKDELVEQIKNIRNTSVK